MLQNDNIYVALGGRFPGVHNKMYVTLLTLDTILC